MGDPRRCALLCAERRHARRAPASRHGRSRTTDSFYLQLRHGWREFWSRIWLWAIVLVSSISNMAMMAPFLVLGAVISKNSLGGRDRLGTILGARRSRGSSRRNRDAAPALWPARSSPLHFSLLVCPTHYSLFAWSAPVPVISVGAFLGGVALAIFETQWQTTMQREVPAEVLSRVSAYDWFGSLVFLPLGYRACGTGCVHHRHPCHLRHWERLLGRVCRGHRRDPSVRAIRAGHDTAWTGAPVGTAAD